MRPLIAVLGNYVILGFNTTSFTMNHISTGRFRRAVQAINTVFTVMEMATA